ncbi:MAG: T9SS type A sorting domain-containing protein [bacterium]
MKTLTLLILLFTSGIFAQTTLTSSINPVPGNTDGYSICDTLNISQGNSGTNQIWNFPNLTVEDTTSVYFVAASSTPYTSTFPTSTIASSNDNTTFNYFTTSETAMIVDGFAGPDLTFHYNDPQTYMQFPFTFNTSFSDNFSGTYTTSGIVTTRTGNTTVSSDAWGTINLPVGSFSNALRVKYIINTKDSSNAGFPLVIQTNLVSYVWFVPGKKFPVFEIIYTTVLFNGTTFATNKSVNYNSNSTPIGIQNISAEVPEGYLLSQNYPNPFNPVTNIEFRIAKQGHVYLKIYDMIGKEAAELVNGDLNAGTYNYDFDASGLTSGVYFYKIIAGDFTETRRMNLIK